MASSPVDSPVGRVVGQMLPGRELAPGTHIQPGGFCDLRHAVPRFVPFEEPIAFRRLSAVISCRRHSGLKHRYNLSQSSGIVAKNLKKNPEFIFKQFIDEKGKL